MTICCNLEHKYPKDIELNAAIQLKNYIQTKWKFSEDMETNKQIIFDEEEIIVISKEDKDYIRTNILDAVIYSVNTENGKVLKQLNPCVKKIIKYDMNLILDTFVSKITQCFSSGNQKEIYAGIIILHQISKIFQYDNDKSEIYNDKVLTKVNDYLISFIEQCNDINNLIQAQFMYKILKIFNKNVQGEISKIIMNENVYEKWSTFIVKVIQTPLTLNFYMIKDSIFWKLKQICYATITRLYSKISLDAIKSKDKVSSFFITFTKKYALIYLKVISQIYSNKEDILYVNDYCLKCIYNFFSTLIKKKEYADEVCGLFMMNNSLKEKLITDAVLPEEEVMLFKTDIKSYISKQGEIFFPFFSKRYEVYKLLDAILSYHSDKETKPKYYDHFIQYLSSALSANNEDKAKENLCFVQNQNFTMESIKFNLIKESIMYLIGMCSETILEHSQDLMENIIEKGIIQELESPIGIMREKACWFLIQVKSMSFKNDKLIPGITTKICFMLENDPCLNVKIKSAAAASALLSQPSAIALFRGHIKGLLSIFIKLLEETETEEIVSSLQIVIKEFKDETEEFIVQLNEYLIKNFNKLKVKEVDDDQATENFSMINSLIYTFEDIVHYFVNSEKIYPQIEKHIEIILDYCINDEAYDKIEEGLEILHEIVSSETALKLSKRMWNYFIPLIYSVIGNENDIADFRAHFPSQIYEGFGYDFIDNISKTICVFIAKDPETFIAGGDTKGNKFFTLTIKLVESIVEISEGKKMFYNTIFAFKLIAIIFDVFRNKVDSIHGEILKFITVKLSTDNQVYRRHLRFLLSSCFIYNAAISIKYYESTGELAKVIKFWFEGLDELKSQRDVKYNLMGLCCMISLEPAQQNALVIQNMKNIIDKIIGIVVREYEKKISDNNTKNSEEEEENDDYLVEEEDDEDIEESVKLTEIDKQNEILFVRDTLSHIASKNIEYYKNITAMIGNRIEQLKEIFKKEEEFQQISNIK